MSVFLYCVVIYRYTRAKRWRRIAKNHLREQNATLLCDSIFRGVLTMICLCSDTWFSIFFLGSLVLLATRTTMNTRCGTWIHLVFVWRRSSPLINFWEPALGRYVCTATPTPITDMETTFWSTDQPPRLILIYPATTENHTPSCNARE